MQIHFDFKPDANRAKLLDKRMHQELGSSLKYLGEQCAGTVTFEREGLSTLVESLGKGERYSPYLFGTYYQLVMQILNDDMEAGAKLFHQVVSFSHESGRQNVISLKESHADAKSRLYNELLEQNASSGISFLPPSPNAVTEFRQSYFQAMALLERAIPELAAEVKAIVREIVCVGGDPNSQMHFDGGSHYQLWGALFLNIDRPRTCYELIEVIAHESAHSMLFGFCTHETLVKKPDEELFESPLRLDKRPMDGIYHATFVSATHALGNVASAGFRVT